jgi:hypothetical protein
MTVVVDLPMAFAPMPLVTGAAKTKAPVLAEAVKPRGSPQADLASLFAPAGGPLCDLPSPTEHQAKEFMTLLETCNHYSVENELWMECIMVLLQKVGNASGMGNFVEELRDEELDALNGVRDSLNDDLMVQKELAGMKCPIDGDILSAPVLSSSVPPSLQDLLSLPNLCNVTKVCSSDSTCSTPSTTALSEYTQARSSEDSTAERESMAHVMPEVQSKSKRNITCCPQALPVGPVLRQPISAGTLSLPDVRMLPQAAANMPRVTDECTLVVRGIPARYVQEDLLDIWDASELGFNFLFLPYSKKQHRSVTYCFINFISEEAARAFQSLWSDQILSGKRDRAGEGSGTVIPLSIGAAQVQGLKPNVLHIATDRKFKSLKFLPAIFDHNGLPMDFRSCVKGMQQEARC